MEKEEVKKLIEDWMKLSDLEGEEISHSFKGRKFTI